MSSRMRPGTRIAGRYRIERKLAQGGMSAVFVAVDEKFEHQVALKLAFPETASFEDFRARFRREAVIGHMLGQLSTGFVRALDWGELEDRSLYLVMDLVADARELDLVSGARVDRLDRLARGTQLVQEVHAVGIIHRDLKPANFLTSADGRIHLADFGLAKILGQEEDDAERRRADGLGHLTSSGLALGTPYYMAPEQASAKHVDQRADVYPLGVMLFLALTSELPYQGNLPELLAAQQRVLAGLDPPPAPRERDATVPPELDALCRRAMALDPDKRLPSANMFLENLLPHVSRVAVARAKPTPRATNPNPHSRATPRRLDPELVRDAVSRDDEREAAHREREAAQREAFEREVNGAERSVRSHGLEPLGRAEADTGPRPQKKPSGRTGSAQRAAPAPAPLPGRRPTGVTGKPPASPPPLVVPTPPSELKPVEGEELAFENTRDGSILVWVPAASFYAGSEGGDEETRQQVRVEGYYLGRYPVTWAQYLHFCHETGREPPNPSFPVEDDHPVHNVSWDDAQTYCAWAATRLPTAVEWELAARGPEGRTFPWGEEPPDVEKCNWSGHPAYGKRTTTPVGLFPAGTSPAGCLDMAGNVAEWVGGDEGDRAGEASRELRGGAYTLGADFLRAARGVFLPGESREPHVGFRVARSATQDNQLLDRTMAARSTRRAPRPTMPLDPRPQLVTPAQGQAIAGLAALVPWFGKQVHARGKEIKFVHEEAQVGLSLIVLDPQARYAFLEQRVTFEPGRVQGKPTGLANLALAVNALNHYATGVRCVITEDRLRFRRELLLEPHASQIVEVDVLRFASDRLVREWSRVFPHIREVQDGMAWHEAVRPLAAPYEASETAASTIDTRLVGSLSTQRLGAGKLLLLDTDGTIPGGITLTCGEDEVMAEMLVRAWTPPIEQVLAIKNGEPSPLIHQLLGELNDKNRTRPYALCWDPKRGVVARGMITGPGILPHAEQLGQFIELLREARVAERIDTIIAP